MLIANYARTQVSGLRTSYSDLQLIEKLDSNENSVITRRRNLPSKTKLCTLSVAILAMANVWQIQLNFKILLEIYENVDLFCSFELYR